MTSMRHLPRWLAFAITFGLLSIVQTKVEMPMLLAERFHPGAGWAEILLVSLYAAFITGKMLDPGKQAVWRGRIWMLFSAVFFGQFILGVSGVDRLLMTGELHLPVPAVILTGPIYRGGGWFMPILFLSTLLLVGPAWCSHLCYIGAWDHAASSAKKHPRPWPGWTRMLRVAILILVILTAILLRMLGTSIFMTAMITLAFGAIGVASMWILSRRRGSMFHCSIFCPLGLVANLLGKISPWRIEIQEGCTHCGLCIPTCRYDALNMDDIRKGRPALSCSLCGDCVGKCPGAEIDYRFLKWKGLRVRTIFIIITISIHSVFLALARI